MRVSRPGQESAHRTHIYDAARSAGSAAHQQCGLLGAEESRLEVDVVDRVPIGFGDFQRIDGRESCRVVDQRVEPAFARGDLGEHLLDFGDALQVGAIQGGAAALGRGLGGLGLRGRVMDQHARAFAVQPQRDRAADAPGSAGDEHDLACEIKPCA